MYLILAIASGGACGAVLRHFMNQFVTHFAGSNFPWGIFVCNLLGSFLMGVLVSSFSHFWDASQNVKAFMAIGMLGAFTTFSAFSMDIVSLIERGQPVMAGFYAGGSVILAVSGLFAGILLVRLLVT